MKKSILLVIVIVSWVSATAFAWEIIPPEERTRIIECNDGSYAVQVLHPRYDKWESHLGGCGWTIEDARIIKWASIKFDKDRSSHPPQPKYPIVVAE